MRFFAVHLQPFATVCVILLAAGEGAAQSDRDFSGVWQLSESQSQIREPASPLGRYLKVVQDGTALNLVVRAQEDGPSTNLTYPLNGKSQKDKVGDSTYNSVTKWEGAALLVNTIVSGPKDYSALERWELSRDRSRLTITRTIVAVRGETESVLVYENPNAEPPAPVRPLAPRQAEAPRTLTTRSEPAEIRRTPALRSTGELVHPGQDEEIYVLATGSRFLVRLTNAVNTKRTTVGDRLYLQTAAPVFVNGHIVVPVGSYVTGTVIEAQRAGRVKGKSSLDLRFESVTLPNGVTRDVRSRAGSVDTQGNLDATEGRIDGESTRGRDAVTVVQSTAAGTGVGAIVGAVTGHARMGTGIGAAAGALGGLAGVLASRGSDVVLPAGTTMELVLDRELRFTETELRGRVE